MDNLCHTLKFGFKANTGGNGIRDKFRNFSTIVKGSLMICRKILPRSYWASLSYSFK